MNNALLTALSMTALASAAWATPAVAVPAEGTAAPADNTPLPATAGPREFEMGVGLFGMVNGSFFSELDDKDKVVRTPDGRQAVVPYPGFGGVGGGGGLSVVGSWRGILGLELQLFNSLDQGSGDINNIEFTVSQSAWHIPILLRAALPAEHVRPYLYVGPEFVLPGTPEITVSSNAPPAFEDLVDAKADTYVAWTAGIGFEFMLPGDYDLRIPLSFGFTWNPSVGDTVDDRTETEVTCQPNGGCMLVKQTYISEWQYQATAKLGFAWYFQ